MCGGLLMLCIGLPCHGVTPAAETDSPDVYGLHFDHIPTVWDEGIPLGNGIMGTLIWQREPASCTGSCGFVGFEACKGIQRAELFL